MFEELPDRGVFADVDDAAVVAAIAGGARAEAAGAAYRLAAIAELMKRRTHDPDDERAMWACDNWDSAAAEVACASGISHRRASTQMRLAEALDERLPRTAELLDAGTLSLRVASTIAWRTQLVTDGATIAGVDAAIADRAATWGVLSDHELDLTIDAVLAEHDPQARRQFRDAARGRDVQVGKPDDQTGTASLWGRLLGTHAVLLKRTLDEISRTVCPDDPRTMGERRSDAFGAVLARSDRLACHCGNPDCEAARIESHASSVVIHVLADEAALHAAALKAETAGAETAGDQSTTPPTENQPQPEQGPERQTPAKESAPTFKAAVIVGGGVVPGPLLAELINSGATVEPLRPACAGSDPRYRPSRKLQRFVRCRDLTCRFPGCNRPADYTDIDHTTPHPAGATHASNLKCLCRKHHLLKTFWAGPGGWSDVQHPDGAIVWTAPSGHTYTTRPASQLVFPDWNTTTKPPPPTDTPPDTNSETTAYRGLMMPKRKRTRAQDRAQRIKTERALNDAHVAERNKPPPI